MQKSLSLSGKIGFILPIMMGCLVVLSMFSSHAHRLGWGQLHTSLAIGAGIGLFFWLAFSTLPLTRSNSAVISCVITLMFMTWMVYPYPIIPTMVMVSTIIVLYDVKPSQSRIVATITFTVVALAIVVSLGQSVYAKASYARNEGMPQKMAVTLGTHTPDIYFIVPDRFTSPSALEECGINIGDFVAELEARGFYVRHDALSEDEARPSGNFPMTTTRTLRFMASVLNMGAEVDLIIPYNLASSQVKNHLVGRILKENGYTYHHIGDWWQETLVNPQADYNYVYEGYSMLDYFASDELAAAIIDMSWLRVANAGSLIPVELLTKVNSERNLYQLATFRDIAQNGEHPKFVFAHILLPHQPYTWAKDGSVRTESMSTMEQYLEQLQFTAGYLLQMIDAIAETDSIIIIQSDEGIAFSSPEKSNKLSNNQWNGVLTAWCVPGEDISEMEDVPITDVLKFVIDSLTKSKSKG